MSFAKLKGTDLVDAANAFAVEVTDADNDKTIRAALVENGVTAKMYADMFPDKAELVGIVKAVPAEKVEPVAAVEPENVVTSPEARVLPKEEETVTVKDDIIVDQGVNFTGGGKFLVKMTRQNPMFEIAGHRFTQEHPYALLDSDRAEVVLSEDGFRQALPSELREYYG